MNTPPRNWSDKNAWDHYFGAELLAHHAYDFPDFIVLRFLKFALEKGGRIWFPGCGLDSYPANYAKHGCNVFATDFSSVAVRYQQQLAAALQHKFAAAEQDFTQQAPDKKFDVVINCCAFQGLSPTAMQAAAQRFYSALRPGGACILDTMNMQGDRCNLIEDSLIAPGFYIPYQRSERWYRKQLADTGIVYGLVMGRPRVPGYAPYPPERFREFAERDQLILDSFRIEYERRREEEAAEVKATTDDPAVIVAHVVYATG